DILVIHHGQEGLNNEKTLELVKLASATITPERIIVIDDKHSSSRGISFHAKGLRHYLARPLNLGQLELTLEMLQLANPTAKPAPATETKAAEPAAKNVGHGYINTGGGESYDALMRSVMKVARLDTTVLLSGETGTGKSHLARMIHESGSRAAKPLVVVNCAAISPALFESELFGHVQGSSASADTDRLGKLTEAAGGTIFLDEIDSLPTSLQARLLRVFEEKVYEPVGSNKTMPLLARIVVASNRDLKTEVAEGRFRSDLFYRLNVVAFEVPPLRARKSLIGNLLSGFLRESSTRMSVKLPAVSPEVGPLLEQYEWPGNIRELRNVVERAVALCDNDLITPDELTEDIRRHGVVSHSVATGHGYSAVFPAGHEAHPRHNTLNDVVESHEREMILDSMNRNSFNLLKTAKDLGISRMTLYKKLEKYQIQGKGQGERHLAISQVG
ncbi:MAG: sigma 54-interacting transcriptional regulator, partial [bacterium]